MFWPLVCSLFLSAIHATRSVRILKTRRGVRDAAEQRSDDDGVLSQPEAYCPTMGGKVAYYVGDDVRAIWSYSAWDATVVEVIDSHTYKIDWDDGDTTRRIKTIDQMCLVARGGGQAQPPPPSSPCGDEQAECRCQEYPLVAWEGQIAKGCSGTARFGNGKKWTEWKAIREKAFAEFSCSPSTFDAAENEFSDGPGWCECDVLSGAPFPSTESPNAALLGYCGQSAVEVNSMECWCKDRPEHKFSPPEVADSSRFAPCGGEKHVSYCEDEAGQQFKTKQSLWELFKRWREQEFTAELGGDTTMPGEDVSAMCLCKNGDVWSPPDKPCGAPDNIEVCSCTNGLQYNSAQDMQAQCVRSKYIDSCVCKNGTLWNRRAIEGAGA